MKLIKLNKTSKGKVGGKSYFYNPIVENEGQYYLCKTIKTPVLLDKKTIDVFSLEIWSVIKPEFYAANGLTEISSTLNVITSTGDKYTFTNVKENKTFKGFFDGLLGSMNVQFEAKSNNKGFHECVFMGVSNSYALIKY